MLAREGIDLAEALIVLEVGQCFFSGEHEVEGSAELLEGEDVLKPNILIVDE